MFALGNRLHEFVFLSLTLDVCAVSIMANKAKVFIVDKDYKADYKVFFVDQPYKEANVQVISPGSIVQHDYQADVKVFIVDKDYKANIKIMRKNFPR